MSVMTKQTARQLALLSNGSYQTGKGNAQNDYIWDRMLCPATIPNQGLVFFRTPLNAQYGAVAGDQKSTVETSMEDNGKLSNGQNFLANAVGINLCSTNGQLNTGVYTSQVDRIIHAWKVIMQHSYWVFKFTNVEYSWRAPSTLFIPSVFEQGGTGLAVSTPVTRVGDFNHHNWVNMPTKVPITQQVNFTMTLYMGSGVATMNTQVINALTFLSSVANVGVEIAVTFRGLLTRAV